MVANWRHIELPGVGMSHGQSCLTSEEVVLPSGLEGTRVPCHTLVGHISVQRSPPTYLREYKA